jgi:aconitase A
LYLASPLTVAASAVAGYIVEYEPSNAKILSTPLPSI